MRKFGRSLLVFLGLLASPMVQAQNSIAHQWMDVSVEAVRNDLPRPTVIARNLYHTSICLYDAWAVYDTLATTVFLGKELGDYSCPFSGIPTTPDVETAREEAMSYAAYRLLLHRYNGPPGNTVNIPMFNQLMSDLGYDISETGTDYQSGDPAQLGNYIAEELIFAAQDHNGFEGDGANELFNYANSYYSEINSDIIMAEYGNPSMGDPSADINRWQRVVPPILWNQTCTAPMPIDFPFLSPEWGNVVGFALDDSVMTSFTDDRGSWKVYHDPGPPPLLSQAGAPSESSEQYKWGFEMVSVWSSHLGTDDGVMWDISPASIGNIPFETLPDEFEHYDQFYNFFDGGDASLGHPINPHTNEAYEPQIVHRGDYARILAEFWADGPDSETPPGHWISIYNEVSQYPEFTWKWEGKGEPIDHLEYDAKAYLALSGALHDAAISAWGIKGYYDYVRPVSAIRAMADVLGQATYPDSTNYHPDGINLYPGYIELIEEGDPIADTNASYIGEIKALTWMGPNEALPCSIGGQSIVFPTDVSGIGWRPIGEWWTYQRPSFVTPPFAGYVSGHSTFSRAAAEVMTLITGDRFFPGGIGVFDCPADSFLVFEQGPTEHIQLQWATYQDASDQCSLSRIWGGIHPPADDIPGRKIGYKVGHHAFAKAQTYFDTDPPQVLTASVSHDLITDSQVGQQFLVDFSFNECMDIDDIPAIDFGGADLLTNSLELLSAEWTSDSTLSYVYTIVDANEDFGTVQVNSTNATDRAGNPVASATGLDLTFDTENPTVSDLEILEINGPDGELQLVFTFSEDMTGSAAPSIQFPVEDPLNGLVDFLSAEWTDAVTYVITYDIIANEEQLFDVDLSLSLGEDMLGNTMIQFDATDALSIDTKKPSIVAVTPLQFIVNESLVGTETFDIMIDFDEAMDNEVDPEFSFISDNPEAQGLLMVPSMTNWVDFNTYYILFTVVDMDAEQFDIDIQLSAATDKKGNQLDDYVKENVFILDTRAANLLDVIPSSEILNDAVAESGTFSIRLQFDEEMDQSSTPEYTFSNSSIMNSIEQTSAQWSSPAEFDIEFAVTDEDVEIDLLSIDIENAADARFNISPTLSVGDIFRVDTQNPEIMDLISDVDYIDNDTEQIGFQLLFDEEMDDSSAPIISFPENPELEDLFDVVSTSSWTTPSTYDLDLSVGQGTSIEDDIVMEVRFGEDQADNPQVVYTAQGLVSIDRTGVYVVPVGSSLENISLFPNPVRAGQEVTVVLAEEEFADLVISLYDASGRTIVDFEGGFEQNGRLVIPTQYLGSGFYFLKIEKQNEVETLRFEIIEE